MARLGDEAFDTVCQHNPPQHQAKIATTGAKDANVHGDERHERHHF